ncbi:MAG TPA: hypothetical protein VMX77_02120, partial [Candidatus Bathyarchaeia archaeon]|nr:hypothetical protein [Candidatus Bathyarchaeia archaeon]
MKDQSFNRLVFFLVLIGLFFLFFLPPADPDLGWQLRCGQQFWEEQKLCNQNNFSVLMENHSWPDARLFYQSLIFPFYKNLNLFGLSLANSLLLLVTLFIWLSLTGKRKAKIAILPLILFLSWSVFGFGIRNQLFSFFLFFILIKVIELTEVKPQWGFFLPLIMFFWANSHGGFVLGIFLLLAFLLEKTVWLILGQKEVKNYFFILILILFSLAATLLNPFGNKIYFEAWRHFSGTPLSHLIAEWVPPPAWLQAIIILLAGVSVWALLQTKKRSEGLFKLLVLAGLAFMALRARRDIIFFFFFAGYLLSLIKIKTRWLAPLTFLASITIFIFGFFFQLPRTAMINTSWERFCEIRYVCQATEFLKKQPEKGNIFNSYEQGGFLIWQLPEYKVFVDGRMPAWPHPSGKSPYTIYLETLQTQP